MRHTSVVSIVIAHGAGSSGAAASTLLGIEGTDGVGFIEDRSGDVDRVVDLIERSVRELRECSHVVGVSLGAHAAVRWAAGRTGSPPIICVLPAWTGDPMPGPSPTSIAAREIGERGREEVLASLQEDARSADVAHLLSIAWQDYTDDSLHTCLTTAAATRGPDIRELGAVSAPVSVIGWYGDAFHPVDTAIEWSRRLPRATIAMAAAPRIRLLQQALARTSWPRPLRRSTGLASPSAAAASAGSHP